MGVFGAFFACIGVAVFNGCCSWASIGDGGFTLACISGCRGVVGFTVTTSVRPEREKVRPAWSGGGCEREKVRPARSKHPKIGLFTLAGRTFSRVGCWRGRAGRTFSRVGRWRGWLGELFRACHPATATSPSPLLPAGPTATPCGASSTLRIGDGGGFAALGAGCRRVAPLMTPIPPFGGREFVAWRYRVRVSGLTCAISPMRVEVVT